MKTIVRTQIIVVFFLCTTPWCLNAQVTVSDLLQDTYQLYDYHRQYNGVYRDSKIIDGNDDYHPSSVATTGVGLISLCVADRAGYITYAKDLAVQTLRTMLGYTPGFTPDRTLNGYYRHFIDIDTGDQAWNSEYSTIDTALLAAGALFAKKYFNDNELSALADELFLSVDWSASISDPTTGAIWRELDENGNGQGTSALPFNEYMIVAYLAMNAEGSNGGIGTTAWNVWTQLDNFANANYWGYELLADVDDVGAFQSSFTIQFPYYLTSWAYNSTSYQNYMVNMASADKLYYQNIQPAYPGLSSSEWGLGAGNSPATYNGTAYTPFGYNADHINNHPARVVSPHIIAGFIPVQASAKSDLQELLNGTKGMYTLSTGEQLLWRYSLDEPTWNSNQIQGVDYSSMLYGLAADAFGSSFFGVNNDYDFPVQNFSNAGACSGTVSVANGTVLGSISSNESTSRDKAFDGNNGTYFHAAAANGQWVGLDLGSYEKISCIRFRPRRNFANRMRGGKFQVANDPTFSNPRTIYTIPLNASLWFRNYIITIDESQAVAAKYIRYLSPNNGWGNIAEMRVYTTNATYKSAHTDNLSTKNIPSDSSVDIYPNPTSDYLQLRLNAQTSQRISYDVYTVQGKHITSLSTSYYTKDSLVESLDVSNLDQGIYFLHVRIGEEDVFVKRFIVQQK